MSRATVRLSLDLFEYSMSAASNAPTCSSDPPRASRALARREDPTTSQLAAVRIDEFVAAHNDKIRAALKLGDATIYELAARTKLDHVQVARRLPYIEGARRTAATRPGPKGRPCGVWTIG